MDTFNFWKDNRKDQHYQLTTIQLVNKFDKWLETKERSWIEYYDINAVVGVFIMEGLNSIGNTENNFAEYNQMEIVLKPIRRDYLERTASKTSNHRNFI